MRKISKFCGIFATLFVTTTMVLLVSCSQDDDNYDSDMYTLAEMGTRISDPTEGGGNPGGGNNNLYYGPNYCGVAAIMAMLGASLDNDYWYGQVLSTAEHAGWKPEAGKGISDSLMLVICANLREKFPKNRNAASLPTHRITNPDLAKATFNNLKNDSQALKKISLGLQVYTLINGEVTLVPHWTGVSSVNGDDIVPRNCRLVDEHNKLYEKFSASQIVSIIY